MLIESKVAAKEGEVETKNVLIDAFKFHGHICWASAIGTRAGLVALRELGVERTGTSGDLHCVIEVGDNHGAQCFADGVQYSTGCTLGKGNIEKSGWGKKAMEQYGEFLDIWKNADPGIEEIEDAQARLAALKGVSSK